MSVISVGERFVYDGDEPAGYDLDECQILQMSQLVG